MGVGWGHEAGAAVQLTAFCIPAVVTRGSLLLSGPGSDLRGRPLRFRAVAALAPEAAAAAAASSETDKSSSSSKGAIRPLALGGRPLRFCSTGGEGIATVCADGACAGGAGGAGDAGGATVFVLIALTILPQASAACPDAAGTPLPGVWMGGLFRLLSTTTSASTRLRLAAGGDIADGPSRPLPGSAVTGGLPPPLPPPPPLPLAIPVQTSALPRSDPLVMWVRVPDPLRCWATARCCDPVAATAATGVAGGAPLIL